MSENPYESPQSTHSEEQIQKRKARFDRLLLLFTALLVLLVTISKDQLSSIGYFLFLVVAGSWMIWLQYRGIWAD